jgi:hypothetical protein
VIAGINGINGIAGIAVIAVIAVIGKAENLPRINADERGSEKSP